MRELTETSVGQTSEPVIRKMRTTGGRFWSTHWAWIAVASAVIGWWAPSPVSAACSTVPGDVNSDGAVDVVDAQCAILAVLFELNDGLGDPPACLPSGNVSSANVNCDGMTTVVDVQLVVLMAFGAPLSAEIDSDADGCPDKCQDADAPVISITSPINFAVLPSKEAITVTGTVEDSSETVVTVNGVQATVDGTTWSVTIPLHEGGNTITAVATDGVGNVGQASITVAVDTKPPIITIETPPDNEQLSLGQVDVAGLVNDILPGTTISSDEVTVTVNGVEAMLTSGAWVVPNLPLQPGPNTITAVATDLVGNQATAEVEVHVTIQAGQQLSIVSGNAQTAVHGTPVPEALVVAVEDDNGDPIVGAVVEFTVTRGDGLVTAGPITSTTVTVESNDDGLVSVNYTLGNRAGAGNHRVTARSPGYIGFVEFCFESLATEPVLISVDMGSGQTGTAGQALPMPYTVLVTDDAGNPLGNVLVNFEVVEGGGHFGGSQTIGVLTNSDGLASTTLTLGPEAGFDNNKSMASFPGMTGNPAVFLASAKLAGDPGATTVSGVVLTNQDLPMPNVTASIKGTNLSATTDDAGQFKITDVPVGLIHLFVNGSTTTLEGTWPFLEFLVTTIPGQDNTVGMPIYLPTLDIDNARLVGGEDDITMQMDGLPGAELTVYANSVTCPDGSPECVVSFSQVNMERVPMPAPMGSTFTLAWTVQPAGTAFNPPAKVCVPNDGRPVGLQMEMFSFDHDVESWVSIGTGTVTADGTRICSDTGFGIQKAGWGGAPPPPPPKKCVGGCDDGNPCTSDGCKDGSCVHTPSGGGCEDDGNPCTADVCQGGSCTHPPTSGGGCPDDGNQCTLDVCENGSCSHPPGNEGGTCSPMGAECTVGKCESGSCNNAVPKPDGTPCTDDGNDCTSDSCKGGSCDHPPKADGTGCEDDGNECTKDQCKGGSCDHPPGTNGTPCKDDGNECTNDQCKDGSCDHPPKPDGTKCGKDDPECGASKCKSGSCEFDDKAKEGQPCDADGKFCTFVEGHSFPKNDSCKGGACEPGPTPKETSTEIDFDVLGKILSIVALASQATQASGLPCYLDFKKSGSGGFKLKKEYSCCEEKHIVSAVKETGNAYLSGEIEAACNLIPFKVPSYLENIFSVFIGPFVKGGAGFSYTKETDQCKDTDKSCINGDVTGSIGAKVEVKIIDFQEYSLISASGSCSGSLGVSVSCCFDQPGTGSAFVGKVECSISVKLSKFIGFSASKTLTPGYSAPFACTL